MIFRAFDDETEAGCTDKYPSTCRVSGLRRELLEDANPSDASGHIYVEVVLHGQTEGQFLEDVEAHRKQTMGGVSKLGGFNFDAVRP